MAGREDLERILAGCRNGDPGCFAWLVDDYSSRCYGYFYRLTGNRDVSEDLLSELFVRLVEKIGTYNGGSFESWLFKIAANIFHDHLRAKQRRKKLIEAHAVHMAMDHCESASATDDRLDKLQTQLARLDDDTRELIMLRFYGQLSFKEIAAMRPEPIGTTLSKMHRGLKKLREWME